MTAALNRTFLSLRVPNYRRYFAGQVISLSGNWMQTVAEMWLVVKLTGSGTAVGLTAALQFLPILVFGAMGGVLADRMSKRRLLHRHPGADGGPRADAVGADGRRPRSRSGWCSRSCSRAARQRARQPRAPELRDRARRARSAPSTRSRSTA